MAASSDRPGVAVSEDLPALRPCAHGPGLVSVRALALEVEGDDDGALGELDGSVLGNLERLNSATADAHEVLPGMRGRRDKDRTHVARPQHRPVWVIWARRVSNPRLSAPRWARETVRAQMWAGTTLWTSAFRPVWTMPPPLVLRTVHATSETPGAEVEWVCCSNHGGQRIGPVTALRRPMVTSRSTGAWCS